MGIKLKQNTLKLGYFVLPKTLISYEYSDSKQSYTTNDDPINPELATSNSIISHSVFSLDDSSAVSLDLKYSQIKQSQDSSTTNNEYYVAAKYYPNPNIYIQGGYLVNTGGSTYDKGKVTLIGIGYALNKNAQVALAYEKFNGDVASELSSSDTSRLSLQYRF